MKTLLLFLTTTIASAQLSLGEAKHNQINIIVDPYATYKDGFINIGGEFEAVLNEVYLKAGGTVFTALEPLYADFYAGFGINLKTGHFDDFRMFSGIKAGWIYRQTAPTLYPIIGIEGGLSHTMGSTFSIGCKLSYDYRGDTEYWSENLEAKFILSGAVLVNIKLD